MDIKKIDTRHATQNRFELSRGNSFPFTGYPFAMNYFSLETDAGNWWFDPQSQHFRGIRLTHQPTMWAGTKGDFCSLRILPVTQETQGLMDVAYNSRKSEFHPNVLSIYQDVNELTTKVIPSEFGGTMLLKGASRGKGIILSFPAAGKLDMSDECVIRGRAQQSSVRSEAPLELFFEISVSTKISTRQDIDEEHTQFVFEGDEIELRIGTSYISYEYAHNNIPKKSEEELYQDITDCWNQKLNKVLVNDSCEERVSTFYHSLYRAFLYPQRMFEFDKDHRPVHFDMHSGQTRPGYLYTNNGLWDTARTVYPLFSLIEKDEFEKILEGFLNVYREGGYLPKWLAPDDGGGMPGNLIDTVIADAAQKNIRLDLMPEFLEAMIHSAEDVSQGLPLGRIFCNEYNRYGYVPSDMNESVNNSLDYSYSDYCIYVVAKKLDQEAVAQKYCQRAMNYRNLFSPEDGFMVARDRNGKFRSRFDPYSWGGDYTEGSAWQSTFAVPQDIRGLINLYGGKDEFEKVVVKLANSDPKYHVGGYGHVIHEMAEMEINKFGQINIGNQPSFHLPYLYSFIGKSFYMQPLLKQIMTKLFNSGWEAYPGDEDNGSMASWFIFSSLGFYPFTAGSNQYVIGMPLFDRVIITLSSGKKLTILTERNNDQAQFIDSILIDNKPYVESYLNQALFEKDTEIKYTLGIVPNPRCISSASIPYSLSDAEKDTSILV